MQWKLIWIWKQKLEMLQGHGLLSYENWTNIRLRYNVWVSKIKDQGSEFCSYELFSISNKKGAKKSVISAIADISKWPLFDSWMTQSFSKLIDHNFRALLPTQNSIVKTLLLLKVGKLLTSS